MHAVAGPEDHAAGNALVRLGDVKAALGHLGLRCGGETAVARRPAAEQPRIGRVAGNLPETLTRRTIPIAGDERDFGSLAGQRPERALDKTLGTAERVVALTNDGDLHA